MLSQLSWSAARVWKEILQFLHIILWPFRWSSMLILMVDQQSTRRINTIFQHQRFCRKLTRFRTGCRALTWTGTSYSHSMCFTFTIFGMVHHQMISETAPGAEFPTAEMAGKQFLPWMKLHVVNEMIFFLKCLQALWTLKRPGRFRWQSNIYCRFRFPSGFDCLTFLFPTTCILPAIDAKKWPVRRSLLTLDAPTTLLAHQSCVFIQHIGYRLGLTLQGTSIWLVVWEIIPVIIWVLRLDGHLGNITVNINVWKLSLNLMCQYATTETQHRALRNHYNIKTKRKKIMTYFERMQQYTK